MVTVTVPARGHRWPGMKDRVALGSAGAVSRHGVMEAPPTVWLARSESLSTYPEKEWGPAVAGRGDRVGVKEESPCSVNLTSWPFDIQSRTVVQVLDT